MRATKKPVEIEFEIWDGTEASIRKIIKLAGDRIKDLLFIDNTVTELEDLYIQTLEGEHFANIGDRIIKGVKGELYPCKPDIFALTYDVGEVE